MISLIRPLFGSGGIFQEPRLDEILNLPLYQLLESATNQMPPMTETELRSLAKIQDEVSISSSKTVQLPVFLLLLICIVFFLRFMCFGSLKCVFAGEPGLRHAQNAGQLADLRKTSQHRDRCEQSD